MSRRDDDCNLLTSCWLAGLAHPPANQKTNHPISPQPLCIVPGVFSQGPASRSFLRCSSLEHTTNLQPTVFQTSNLRSICNPFPSTHVQCHFWLLHASRSHYRSALPYDVDAHAITPWWQVGTVMWPPFSLSWPGSFEGKRNIHPYIHGPKHSAAAAAAAAAAA